MNNSHIFICFAAEDRYTIAEPIVYHLKNYGLKIWYDRYEMIMGDNREEKNLKEGAGNCQYAVVILSKDTYESPCAMEEISIIKERYRKNKVTVFPILYVLFVGAIGSAYTKLYTPIMPYKDELKALGYSPVDSYKKSDELIQRKKPISSAW